MIDGVVGYKVVEGWSLLDALYMTVITLATVGFREVQPLDAKGQAFTISLILAGVLAGVMVVSGPTRSDRAVRLPQFVHDDQQDQR
jgi:voltage-gated potassium channel